MPKFWDKPQHLGPSAGLVQQHYVEARLAEIKRSMVGLDIKIVTRLNAHPAFAHMGDLRINNQWLKIYEKIQAGLQAADMTINFDAPAWFTEENRYVSYTQVYERTAGNHYIGLSSTRIGADDAVTIPSNWVAPPRPAQRLPGPAPGQPSVRRGLTPGIQTGARIAQQMRFGGANSVYTNEDVFSPHFDRPTGFASRNPYFNPKTKQIFAALNYGRSVQGPAPLYGTSFFVLHPKFKVNALYFPFDTYLESFDNTGVSNQVPYSKLGAILAFASRQLFTRLIDACYLGKQLVSDASGVSPWYLLEGHIFSALPFANNLVSVHINTKDHQSAVALNAKKFADKHGAKLFFV